VCRSGWTCLLNNGLDQQHFQTCLATGGGSEGNNTHHRRSAGGWGSAWVFGAGFGIVSLLSVVVAICYRRFKRKRGRELQSHYATAPNDSTNIIL
jgi:hypothetical protein